MYRTIQEVHKHTPIKGQLNDTPKEDARNDFKMKHYLAMANLYVCMIYIRSTSRWTTRGKCCLAEHV